jgi:hypothetical protein
VGLTNTKDRLRLHYKDSFLFQYTERPAGGVQIDISIPYKGAGQETEKVAPTLRLETLGDTETELPSSKVPAEQRVLHELK